MTRSAWMEKVNPPIGKSDRTARHNGGNQNPETLSGWHEIQEQLAREAGLALLLVDGPQPPSLVTVNNNSICRAIQSSPGHVSLCDPYCGAAHSKALAANDTVHYQCHVGLHCFAKPVQIGKRQLSVIGGRAFLGAKDYREAIDRFSNGDLRPLITAEPFSNVLFSVPEELTGLQEKLERAIRQFNSQTIEPEAPTSNSTAVAAPDETWKRDELERLRSQVESHTHFAESLHYFLERISSTNPEETYLAILMNSKELLRAERASLLVFDDIREELTLKAAFGIDEKISNIEPIQLGEGISGQTLERGKPSIVQDIETTDLVPAPAERSYRTNSFISYPLIIGGRKVGLLNLTDKAGGGSYDDVDLSLLELVAPQIALALERADWQERAGQFQLMSITDPLTGLPNRRYLEERISEEVNRSKRYDHPMSFLMIDIDDFKTYNDLNLHQAGDDALRITAQALKASLRSADVASRYGGEEFSILLPQTSAHEAAVIAERIRDKVENTSYPHARTQPLGAVTVSIGAATFTGGNETAEEIIRAADRALYEAKRLGKNRVKFYEELSQTIATNERG